MPIKFNSVEMFVLMHAQTSRWGNPRMLILFIWKRVNFLFSWELISCFYIYVMVNMQTYRNMDQAFLASQPTKKPSVGFKWLELRADEWKSLQFSRNMTKPQTMKASHIIQKQPFSDWPREQHKTSCDLVTVVTADCELQHVGCSWKRKHL